MTIERQIEIENEQFEAGLMAYDRAVLKAREGGREDQTRYGTAMIQHTLGTLTDAIQSYLDKALSGSAGNNHVAARYINLLPANVTAFITLRMVVADVHLNKKLTALSASIGREIADEVRYRAWKKVDRKWYQWAQRRAAKATEKHTKKAILNASVNKTEATGEFEWIDWPVADMVHVGQALLEMLHVSTGLIEITRIKQGRVETPLVVQPTPATLEWIAKCNAFHRVLSPMRWPMVVKPQPWTSVYGPAGYFTDRLAIKPLVKSKNRAFLEELSNRDLSGVFEAVNALQDTGFKVNGWLLDVMEQVKALENGMGGLPCPAALHPPAAIPTDADNETVLRYRKAKADYHRQLSVMGSKISQLTTIMTVAMRFRNEEAIYFPHQLDFRGRAYCVPSALNPQGPDYAKALLKFAEGKPIETEEAVLWLAITGSNLWGNDKVTFEEREQWVYENEEMIFAIAADPMANTQWADADSPWQFLAWCKEWSDFKAHGVGYVSSFVCSMDASASGIQHFSAMLRDENGAAAVNVLPAEKPQDIYARVAERVIARLNEMVASGGEDAPMAAKWLAFGVNRKTTKRSVMVLPYGGTKYSCREFVESYLNEAIDGGKENPFADDKGKGTFAASKFLAPLVWEGIGDVVVGARTVMDWLQNTARVAAKACLPVHWSTPDGLIVMQAYPKYAPYRIKTTVFGSTVFMSLAKDTNKLDVNRQANGISPNFVHSMDACQLRMATLYAKDNGVNSFAMVHDSYGTVAADCAMLAGCARHAFRDMYQTDVISMFKDEITQLVPEKHREEIPAVPERGQLDLDQVLHSAFFFA